MTRYAVEISGENPALARAEIGGAVEALGGRVSASGASTVPDGLVEVEMADDGIARALAGRLALAWRVLRPWAEVLPGPIAERFRVEGAGGLRAMLRPIGAPRSPVVRGPLGDWAREYKEGGGTIDLEKPDRQFYLGRTSGSPYWVSEMVAPVDRAAYNDRRLPKLPFRRPVSLPPRLGRVLVNLARVKSGDRVVDPFVGTGSLMIEAALLGAKVTGVDRDSEMVRGAIRNFEHLDLSFERLTVGDAEEAAGGGSTWDAIVTDPPYGRASGSGGEAAGALLARVLPRWADQVRPGGFIALAVPSPGEWLGAAWELVAAVPDRVHRSLTREFRAYRRRSTVQ